MAFSLLFCKINRLPNRKTILAAYFVEIKVGWNPKNQML